LDHDARRSVLEEPAHYAHYRFVLGHRARKHMAELRALPANRRPDLILVAAHEGLGREPKSGATAATKFTREPDTRNRRQCAHRPIVFGHTHQELHTARQWRSLVSRKTGILFRESISN